MITLRQLKKALKRALPTWLLEVIQRPRRAFARPSPEVETMRGRHGSYQTSEADQITLRPNLSLRIHPESRQPFEWFCFRSPDMVRELDFFISHLDSYSSFVDVGANHGIFSLVFAKVRPGAEVLSIDPSPVAFEILNRNRDLNSFEHIQTRNVACGAARGEVRMKRNWHHLEAVDANDPSSDIEIVNMLPLDELCAEHEMRPEIIKVDVEGFELPVLQGATRVLKAAKLLLLEVHPDRIDELHLSQAAIFDLLTAANWQVMDLSDQPIGRAEFIDRIHTFWTVCHRLDGATP